MFYHVRQQVGIRYRGVADASLHHREIVVVAGLAVRITIHLPPVPEVAVAAMEDDEFVEKRPLGINGRYARRSKLLVVQYVRNIGPYFMLVRR